MLVKIITILLVQVSLRQLLHLVGQLSLSCLLKSCALLPSTPRTSRHFGLLVLIHRLLTGSLRPSVLVLATTCAILFLILIIQDLSVLGLDALIIQHLLLAAHMICQFLQHGSQ